MQPYVQLFAPTVDDEDDRADQLLKRTRLEEEAATTTTSSSSPLRSVSSVSSVLSPIGSASSVNVSPLGQPSGAALFAVSPCVGGGGGTSPLESVVAAAVSAVLRHVSSPSPVLATRNSHLAAVGSLSSPKKYNRGLRPCFQFKNTGQCSQGNQCPFQHITPKKK